MQVVNSMLGRRPKHVGLTRGLFYLPRVTGDSGLYADDREGRYLFSDFFKELAEFTDVPRSRLSKERPDAAINFLIQNHGLVVVCKDHERNFYCYSLRYQNKLPEPFLDRVRGSLLLLPSQTVFWADDVFKEPQQGSAREIVFGERLEKR